MKSPERIAGGAIRGIFEENLFNAEQVKKLLGGACGSALARYGCPVLPPNDECHLHYCKVPLDSLSHVRDECRDVIL